MKLKKIYPHAYFGAIVLMPLYLFIAFNTNAQTTNDIPQVVLTAFSTGYPQAQLKKWKENKDTCIAFFAMNNEKHVAYYSKNGNWLITESEIKRPADLPAELQSYLKTNSYASWKIDDMKRVSTPAQNIYLVHLDNHGGNQLRYEDAISAVDKILSFDDNGKLIAVKEL